MPVIDTIDDWLDTQRMFAPIDRDENGARVVGRAWTGTLGDGRRSTSTCTNWTGTSGTGASGNATSTMTAFAQNGAYGCDAWKHHLYCFEVGRNVSVTPMASAVPGRLAFISSRGRTQQAPLLGDLDNVCQTDAIAAGKSGTFVAAAALSTASIQARFVADARPWVRPDGSMVAVDGASLFTMRVASFVNQLADGTYVADVDVLTGAARPDLLGDSNCVDWSGFNSGDIAFTGYPEDTEQVWNGGPISGASNTTSCASTASRVLCLEQ